MGKRELVDEAITRSIDKIYPSPEKFRDRLLSGEKLNFYMGIDPTADYVHLGHATNYLVLERFHQLGHKITVLVGDFTAMIGDPSDKTAARNQLSVEQVQNNLKTFKRQIGKILDFDNTSNPIEFKFNSKWLSKLTFSDTVELASHFTVQQMIERDAFQKRLAQRKPLYVHEFFYPLLQGYDSVALDTDCEIGGTDQTFNMLAGRTLLKQYKDKEKYVITTTLLENPKTGEKLMSKSLGTGIGLDEPAEEMFRKVMELPDCALEQLFVDCTKVSLADIHGYMNDIKMGTNPRDIKIILAYEIVSLYHSASIAQQARQYWLDTISKKAKADYEKLKINDLKTIETAVAKRLQISKSQLRRLLKQGAIRIDGEKIFDDLALNVKSGSKLSVGKKHNFIVIL